MHHFSGMRGFQQRYLWGIGKPPVFDEVHLCRDNMKPHPKVEFNMLPWEWRSALVSQLFSETLAYLLSWGLRPKWTASGDKFTLFKLNLRLNWKSVTCISHAGLSGQSVNQMHVCLENNINGWLIKQQKCISFSSGSWKSEIREGRSRKVTV